MKTLVSKLDAAKLGTGSSCGVSCCLRFRPDLRRQTSSGLGLKRVWQEGAPRTNLLSHAHLGHC